MSKEILNKYLFKINEEYYGNRFNKPFNQYNMNSIYSNDDEEDVEDITSNYDEDDYVDSIMMPDTSGMIDGIREEFNLIINEQNKKDDENMEELPDENISDENVENNNQEEIPEDQPIENNPNEQIPPENNMNNDMGMDNNLNPNEEQVPQDPEYIGRVYELKKIYSRLVSIESFLNDVSDEKLLKLRNYISLVIELFETLINNIDAYKDNIDKIIVLFYKFLLIVYSLLNKFYEEENEDKNK